ncbi:DUF5518 domain-containing protein [Halomicroarcula sp. F13]|uniref:DUF5518 domain-containing protein n=1 Tax=Haloarcula rubra TaxID=2487747 RepID=A0AAW4PW62_9EURY|nr:DUF5518 domain-containing protein [Halomicroarcula rubra]MBX0325429.1 DUF5518 domain-containing protein [Halomicroarcula rubra]
MPLHLDLSKTWKYAMIGGVLAAPFTALEAWQSPENMTLEMIVVGSALAGYLIKRDGGNSTATGLRAALVGGLPALWALTELLQAVPTLPNPLWFQATSIIVILVFGGTILSVIAVLGALAGRFGGWLAERRGHGKTPDARGSVE